MTATIRRASPVDLQALTTYLAGALGGTPHGFERYLEYPWLEEKPELGFLIEDESRIRGFIGTIYADRTIRGTAHRFCNLTSIAVDTSHRKLSLQLFKAALAQKQQTITSFSPSPAVIEILRFFKFKEHAVSKLVLAPVANVAGARALFPWRAPKIVSSWRRLRSELSEPERKLVLDHARAKRVRAFLMTRGSKRTVVITTRRGRTVRAYTEILYMSDSDLAMEWLPWLQVAIAARRRTLVTMVETRLLNHQPALAYVATKFRPLMFRSPTLSLGDIDALYTELCL